MYKELHGEKIILRRIELADAVSIAGNANIIEVIEAIHLPNPYTTKDAEEYVSKTKGYWETKKEAQFGIEDKESKKVVGMIGLMDLDFESKHAEIGYWLGKEHWGKGLASEALKMIVKYAFEDLKLKKVFAKVAARNVSSNKLLERNGFVLEGKLRQQGMYFGQLDDEMIWGQLETEKIN